MLALMTPRRSFVAAILVFVAAAKSSAKGAFHLRTPRTMLSKCSAYRASLTPRS